MDANFTIGELLDMQRALQDKYLAQWGGTAPEAGAHQLLWGIGEIGEVIDIIKKRGHKAIMDDPATRANLIEELGDVFMYLFDVMLCYGVTSEEFCRVYGAKHLRNMTRWLPGQEP